MPRRPLPIDPNASPTPARPPTSRTSASSQVPAPAPAPTTTSTTATASNNEAAAFETFTHVSPPPNAHLGVARHASPPPALPSLGGTGTSTRTGESESEAPSPSPNLNLTTAFNPRSLPVFVGGMPSELDEPPLRRCPGDLGGWNWGFYCLAYWGGQHQMWYCRYCSRYF
ncbi:uncharacterized protein EHS24_005040 [Apiotrichum porosum]|uniref:Uncharacterized protein n=1 Tax=Apiotrichum porosum TaxID=105984 RepID=A0A427Y6Q3_9TREE|nr:uncharacterized protein EHS24_005040 [Apiotrichum porosum]RSH86768.1 hypothetical protein EHS24_005040 [Apiotrichum porosum]